MGQVHPMEHQCRKSQRFELEHSAQALLEDSAEAAPRGAIMRCTRRKGVPLRKSDIRA